MAERIELLQDYLRRYPNGYFSELAQLELDRELARQGERKIAVAAQEGNPYTRGSAEANTDFRIGDTYDYSRQDPFSGAELRKYTLVVEQITDREVIFKGRLIVDPLGNVIRQQDGRLNTASQFLPREYAVGKHWSNRFISTATDGRQSTVEMELKIVAREQVKVLAGSFDVFRIEWVGSSVSAAGPAGGQGFLLKSPLVRLGIVSQGIWRLRGAVTSAERHELVAYKQA